MNFQHYINHHELEEELTMKQIPVHVTSDQISFCKASSLVIGVPEHKDVMVSNLVFLIHTCSYLFIGSTFVLFIEILIKNM